MASSRMLGTPAPTIRLLGVLPLLSASDLPASFACSTEKRWNAQQRHGNLQTTFPNSIGCSFQLLWLSCEQQR